MFKSKCTYRHNNPSNTLDIYILAIYNINYKRIKMKVNYINKLNKRLQYTGKGRDGYSDTIEILAENYKDWEKIS